MPTKKPTLPDPANVSDDINVLLDFLNYPLTGTDEIFKRFQTLPGAITYGLGRKQVVYIEGKRHPASGRVLLVAHADTAWDRSFDDIKITMRKRLPLKIDNGVIRSGNKKYGIGADDRAGLAILWLLRNSGHSIMVPDLEEQGCLGSCYLRENEPELLSRINRDHAFAIQFDRCGGKDFKCYDVGTPGFRAYLKRVTGYREPDKRSSTDIRILCEPSDYILKMSGVNLSIGYYDEHSHDERLVINEWLHTLNLARAWLSADRLPTFHR